MVDIRPIARPNPLLNALILYYCIITKIDNYILVQPIFFVKLYISFYGFKTHHSGNRLQ